MVARLGDFQAGTTVLDEALPRAREVGYFAFETEMRITRAEIALAQADLERAASELTRVEAILPQDYWYDARRLRTARAVLQHANGDDAAALAVLERLHADALRIGDVVAELRIHSLLAPAHLGTICSRERHENLIATSGMRGRYLIDTSRIAPLPSSMVALTMEGSFASNISR